MKRRQLLGCLFVAALGLIATSGCGDGGPAIAKVTGKVTVKGAAIKGATVQFYPEKGPMAVGITDDQGNFTLTTNGRAGAPVGMNKVSISKPAAAATNSMPANPSPEDMAKMAAQAAKGGNLKRTEPPKSEIPEQYGNPETSKLTADVSSDASKNVFEFPLQ
ncbi:MAG: hypothetical protein J0M26_13690 [Planctomycetes bacterium]|nr:hypothetical protein [Planctomycetota bacterium]